MAVPCFSKAHNDCLICCSRYASYCRVKKTWIEEDIHWILLLEYTTGEDRTDHLFFNHPLAAEVWSTFLYLPGLTRRPRSLKEGVQGFSTTCRKKNVKNRLWKAAYLWKKARDFGGRGRSAQRIVKQIQFVLLELVQYILGVLCLNRFGYWRCQSLVFGVWFILF